MFAVSLYSPIAWKNMTSIVNNLLEGNYQEALTLYELRFGSLASPTVIVRGSDAIFGVQCSDNIARADSLDDLLPMINLLSNTSRILGNALYIVMTCPQWKIEPKERFDYKSDHVIETKTPVLLIGNTLDGHTPLKSAFNVSASFKDSVVLELNAYGVS